MIKDAYSALKKRFAVLPEYEKLDEEFEISAIEKPAMLLEEIKKKIAEKLEWTLELLEKTIQPDPSSLIDMYEYKHLSNEDKEQLFAIFKKMMVLHRRIVEANCLRDEKNDAALIKQICEEWPSLRMQLVPFIKKMGECWQRPAKKKEVQDGYFG